MKDGNDFLIAEHSSLRAEIIAIAGQTWSIDKLSITLSAAIWVWVLSHKIDVVSEFSSILPLIICIIILIYKELLWRDVKRIGGYLKNIEDRLLKDINTESSLKFGWENYLVTLNKDKVYYMLAGIVGGIQIVTDIFLIFYVFLSKQ